MSHFKVVPAASVPLEQRQITLPPTPSLTLPSQIILLTYSLDQLAQQIQGYFEDPPLDQLSLERTLKVVGRSLNDGKLMNAIEKIIAGAVNSQAQQAYTLMVYWTSLRFSLADLLTKFSPSVRKSLILLIFQEFLMGSYCRQVGIRQQIGSILTLTSQGDLLQNLKKKYQQRNSPLKLVIGKCVKVNTENQSLRKLLVDFSTFCISSKLQRIMQFSIVQQKEELQYLIQNVPTVIPTLIQQTKLTLNESALPNLLTNSVTLNSVLQLAAKEWLNEQNNYWNIVLKNFGGNFGQEAKTVLSYGKMLLRETLQSQCLTVKLLYFYFQGQYFDFAAGDALLMGLEKEGWTDTYKALTRCCSQRMINLTLLSKTAIPVWWKISDPRKKPFSNKQLKKLIQKYDDFFEEKEKELAAGNKRIELAFSTLIVIDKETNQQRVLTFQQLQRLLSGEKISQDGYKEEYPPLRTEVKQKEEVKKEHNIIIQAKLVRILKRAKQSLTIQDLTKETRMSTEIVELGIKRLVSKSLAEEEEGQGKYKYLA